MSYGDINWRRWQRQTGESEDDLKAKVEQQYMDVEDQCKTEVGITDEHWAQIKAEFLNRMGDYFPKDEGWYHGPVEDQSDDQATSSFDLESVPQVLGNAVLGGASLATGALGFAKDGFVADGSLAPS